MTSLLYDSIDDKSPHADDFYIGTSVSTSGAAVQAGFIRKVYSLLGVQLAITAAVCFLCMYLDPLYQFMLADNFVNSLIFIVFTFVTLFGTIFSAQSSPANLIWLTVFTVSESFTIGSICAKYRAVGRADLILQAVALTAFVFIALTFYTFQSGVDFNSWGQPLHVALLAFIGITVMQLILAVFFGKHYKLVNILIAFVGVVLFSLFVVYDTSQIMHRRSPDEYIMAVLDLYLDILNLFLQILTLLSEVEN